MRMTFASMEALEEHVFAKAQKKCTVAVIEAAESHVLEAVCHATKKNLVSAMLYGNAKEIENILRGMGENPDGFEIIDASSPEESAFLAGVATKEGKADFLLKGLIPTGVMLKNLFRKETDFRVGKLISHMNIVQFDNYHKLLALTDASINVQPTLEQKKDILTNAVQTLCNMGISTPKVAVISSSEAVSEKVPDSLEALALKNMYLEGQITDCIVEGPISLDLAISEEAANIKGYTSPVVGDADLLVCPNITSANVLIKCFRYAAKAATAGIVIGGRVPIVLTSRATSSIDKYRTMVLAASASM